MFEETSVICPYFRKIYKANKDGFVNRIRCEGFVSETNTEINFGRRGQADRYKCIYCDTHNYNKCYIAKILESKYEQG